MTIPDKPLQKYMATTVAVLFLLIILLGLVSAVLPAFGFMPVLGMTEFSLTAWQSLFATPGLSSMLGLTLFSGLASTFISLLLALSLVSAAWDKPWWRQAERWLAPVMAVPHVAYAVGLAFLLMPSGFLFRLITPLAGWSSPPDVQTAQDPFGLSLILILILKETPFLVMMLMATVTQLPVRETLRTGQGLGYQPWLIWVKILWPQLYQRIRLSLLTVLVFSLSVVDVAIVLGPSTPPTLAVQVLHWFQNPDLDFQLLASAGSVLLVILALGSIALVSGVERLLPGFIRQWFINGCRGSLGRLYGVLAVCSWKSMLWVFVASASLLMVWSFSWRWRFPSLWPQKWSFRSWEKAWPQIIEPLQYSLLIGVVSAGLGVLLAVLMLEAGKRQQRILGKIMYLPLLLPQLTFLFGIQVWMIRLALEGRWLSVVFMHLLFVLPYCYLSLSGPWLHYDQRHTRQGWLLSGSRINTFLNVKCRILAKPLLTCFALGFAVSIAQYLPTLFAGAGRVNTVTTETVALASGGNRRVIAVYALVQMLLPLLVYGLFSTMGRWQIRQWRLVRRWV